MSLTDRVLDALKSALQLEIRVAAMADNVGELAREVRDMDKRLVRIETLVEFSARRTPSISGPRSSS